MDNSNNKKEHFVRVPEEIYGAALAYEFNKTQLKAVLYIIRKTFGYKDKADGDFISISKMAKDTGLSRVGMSRAIADLEKLHVIDTVRSKQSKTSLIFMQVNHPKHWDVPISVPEKWWEHVK